MRPAHQTILGRMTETTSSEKRARPTPSIFRRALGCIMPSQSIKVVRFTLILRIIIILWTMCHKPPTWVTITKYYYGHYKLYKLTTTMRNLPRVIPAAALLQATSAETLIRSYSRHISPFFCADNLAKLNLGIILSCRICSFELVRG